MITYIVEFSGKHKYRSRTGFEDGGFEKVISVIIHHESCARHNQIEILARVAYDAMCNACNRANYYPTMEGFSFKVVSVKSN